MRIYIERIAEKVTGRKLAFAARETASSPQEVVPKEQTVQSEVYVAPQTSQPEETIFVKSITEGTPVENPQGEVGTVIGTEIIDGVPHIRIQYVGHASIIPLSLLGKRYNIIS